MTGGSGGVDQATRMLEAVPDPVVEDADAPPSVREQIRERRAAQALNRSDRRTIFLVVPVIMLLIVGLGAMLSAGVCCVVPRNGRLPLLHQAPGRLGRVGDRRPRRLHADPVSALPSIRPPDLPRCRRRTRCHDGVRRCSRRRASLDRGWAADDPGLGVREARHGDRARRPCSRRRTDCSVRWVTSSCRSQRFSVWSPSSSFCSRTSGRPC